MMMKSKGKILVVDDSKVMRSIVRMLLENGGYEVCEAADGKEALKQLLLNHDVKLVTLDVDMPVMNGFETCKHIRMNKELPAKIKTLPVLFVTSFDSLEDRRKGFELGASDFLIKESLEKEMLSAVNRLLNPNENLIGLSALIVDDSIFARKIVAHALNGYGVITTEAEDGQKAYDLLRQSAGSFDLIITDLDMPVMNGMELTHKVRNELEMREIPLLILSGTGDKVTQIELFKAGITDYLTKPFIKEELLGRLKAHIDVIMYQRRILALEQELKLAQSNHFRAASESADLRHILCSDIANSTRAMNAMLETIGDNEERFGIFREDLNRINAHNMILLNYVAEDKIVKTGNIELPLDACDLKAAVKEAVTILDTPLNAKEMNVNINIEDGILVLVEDTTFVNCVLNNLIANAIKFSPSGSSIDISATPGKYIELSIRDYGSGISRKTVTALTGAHKNLKGIGEEKELHGGGLSIMKKLISAYGGRITIKSANALSGKNANGTEIILKLESAI
jgi:CheY-like chemotaxis protein